MVSEAMITFSFADVQRRKSFIFLNKIVSKVLLAPSHFRFHRQRVPGDQIGTFYFRKFLNTLKTSKILAKRINLKNKVKLESFFFSKKFLILKTNS